MFIAAIIFLTLTIIIFFTSQGLIKNLFKNFFLLTKNKLAAIQIITWFLLPGTVIHELSHMLVAEILGVRTGAFSFIPEQIDETRFKVGSLKINKTDPFRYTLIGLAPLLLGLIIVFAVFKFGLESFFRNPSSFFSLHVYLKIFYLFLTYLLFTVINTMFSSQKDLEAVLIPLVFFLILLTSLWLARFELSFSHQTLNLMADIIADFNKALFLGLILNLLVLGLTKLINFVIIKIYGH